MLNSDTVHERAVEVLGSKERAVEWLETASRTLGGRPIDLLGSEEGCSKVMHHLHNIEINVPE